MKYVKYGATDIGPGCVIVKDHCIIDVSHNLTFFTCVLIQVEAFNLSKGDQQGHKFKRPYAYISEDEDDAVSGSDDDFEIDSTALKGILNNTGIKVQAWCSVS